VLGLSVPDRAIGMSLQRKTFTILSVTIVGLTVLLYFVTHVFAMRRFFRLEDDQARITVERVRSELFNNSLANLTATTNDYGAWDRMYQYVAKPSPKAIADEFQDGTLQGLRINSVLVTDISGHVIFSKAYDFHQHTSAEMPLAMQQSLVSDSWVQHVISSSTHAYGVLLVPDGIVLIAACPITTTEHRGPVRGVVVMTRNLDPQALADLQTVTRTNLSIALAAGRDLPADFQWARTQLLGNAESFPVRALNSNTVSAYAMLRDIHGEQAIILRADGDRRISQSGLTGIHYFLAALCILGVSFGFTTWYLLHHTVLSRLAQFRNQVSQITAFQCMAKHVQVSGDDEIAELGTAINSMLDIVRSTEIKLDLLANNIHQVFWVKDPATQTFYYVSSSYQKIWGQSCESLYQDPFSWMRAIIPEDKHIGEQIVEHQKRGERGDVEFRITDSDGRTRWIWDRYFPVSDTSGTTHQYIGILEDITEYKDAEHVLLHSQDQLWNAMMHRRGKVQADESAVESNAEAASPVNT
jgi:PAS domain S-box-containing protein